MPTLWELASNTRKGVLALALGLLLPSSPAYASRKPIICLGDSVTAAPTLTPHSFCSLLVGQNLGVGSTSTRDIKLQLPYLISLLDKLRNKRSTTIIIMYGLNDAVLKDMTIKEFRKNLKYLIKKLHKHKVHKIILMTSNATTSTIANQTLKPYILATRELARDLKIDLVDNYTIFSELQAEGEPVYLDYAHPNALGHFYIYEAISKVLNNINK
ncbi:MAG: GDSL-like Lipase/Acylhydrolase [Parcubacteria group bacterium ADurb.Bin216]|nr:MAG: GDSL-like Lipase/Acylhydrolase [Parcubacteria group bacterium ADurb.Bin216]